MNFDRLQRVLEAFLSNFLVQTVLAKISNRTSGQRWSRFSTLRLISSTLLVRGDTVLLVAGRVLRFSASGSRRRLFCPASSSVVSHRARCIQQLRWVSGLTAPRGAGRPLFPLLAFFTRYCCRCMTHKSGLTQQNSLRLFGAFSSKRCPLTVPNRHC